MALGCHLNGKTVEGWGAALVCSFFSTFALREEWVLGSLPAQQWTPCQEKGLAF
jgi:hypothetical protein